MPKKGDYSDQHGGAFSQYDINLINTITQIIAKDPFDESLIPYRPKELLLLLFRPNFDSEQLDRNPSARQMAHEYYISLQNQAIKGIENDKFSQYNYEGNLELSTSLGSKWAHKRSDSYYEWTEQDTRLQPPYPYVLDIQKAIDELSLASNAINQMKQVCKEFVPDTPEQGLAANQIKVKLVGSPKEVSKNITQMTESPKTQSIFKETANGQSFFRTICALLKELCVAIMKQFKSEIKEATKDPIEVAPKDSPGSKF